MKTCTKCGAVKTFTEYSKDKKARDGHKPACKACNKQDPIKKREAHLKSTYGLSLQDYDNLLDKQGGACAICGTTNPQRGRFHVDHNHQTDVVRGLLCSNCNTAIGLLSDNPNYLDNAAAYLRSRGHAVP